MLGPRGARGAEAGGRPGGGGQARPRADADRRLGAALATTRSPTRRTSRPPRRRRSSCCSARTRAGSAATGAPRRCCAAPEGRAALRHPGGRARARPLHLGRAKGPDKLAPERAPRRRDPLLPRLMLPRADAVAALASEEFDVLVIGGGITGAGVALDAATRGYSVALVEKADFAARHLVALEQARPRRPALPAELRPRAGPRGAARAPAQRRARPAPRAAAADDRARLRGRPARPPDRHRAEHVRRDGGRPAAALAARPPPHPRPQPRRPGGLEPGAPPRDRRRRGRASCCPRSPPREPTGGYLFYDCQTDDVRLVLTVLGEAERFGAVFANGLEVTGAGRGGRARPRRRTCATPTAARRSRSRAAGGRQRHRRVGRPHPARTSCTTRPRCRSSGPAAARTSSSRAERLPVTVGAIVPAPRRAHDLRAAVARPDADRHDRQRLRGRHRPRAARRGRRRVPARGRRRVLRHRARRRATSRAPTRACGR